MEVRALVFSGGGSLPRNSGNCRAASRSAAPSSSRGVTRRAARMASLQSRSICSAWRNSIVVDVHPEAILKTFPACLQRASSGRGSCYR